MYLKSLTNMLRYCTEKGLWDINGILPDFADCFQGINQGLVNAIEIESILTAGYIAQLYLYPPEVPSPEVEQMLKKINDRISKGKLPDRLTFFNYFSILQTPMCIPGGFPLWRYLFQKLSFEFCKLILGDKLKPKLKPDVRKIHSFSQSLLYMINNKINEYLDIYHVFFNGCYNPYCPGTRCKYCGHNFDITWHGFGNQCPDCGRIIKNEDDISPHPYMDWFAGCNFCGTPLDEKKDKILLKDWMVIPSNQMFFSLQMKHCVDYRKHFFNLPSLLKSKKFDKLKKIWINYSSNVSPFTFSTLPIYVGVALFYGIKKGCGNYFEMHNIFCPMCGRFCLGRPTNGWRRRPPNLGQQQIPQVNVDFLKLIFPKGIPDMTMNEWRNHFVNILETRGMGALVLTLFFNRNSELLYLLLSAFSVISPMIYPLISPVFLFPIKPINGEDLTDDEIKNLAYDILEGKNLINREIATVTETDLLKLIHVYISLIKTMGYNNLKEYTPRQFETFHTSFRGAKNRIKEKIVDAFYFPKIVCFRLRRDWHVALLAYLKRHGYKIPQKKDAPDPNAWKSALQGGINRLDREHLQLPRVREIRNILQEHFDWILKYEDILDWKALLDRWKDALKPQCHVGMEIQDKKILDFFAGKHFKTVIDTIHNYKINGNMPGRKKRKEIINVFNQAIRGGGNFAGLFGFQVSINNQDSIIQNKLKSIIQNRRILEEIYPGVIGANRMNPDPVAIEIARQFDQNKNDILGFGFSEIFDRENRVFKPILGPLGKEDRYVHRYLDELFLALPLISVNERCY